MNYYFAIAALLSAGALAAHVIGGGRFYVRPLLAAKGLHPVPKYVHYYCWHIVTMLLAAMAISFGRAAAVLEARELAVMMTALASGLSIWSFGLVLWKRQRPLQMPQWALLTPVAIFGILGLLVGTQV